ncbi:AarF/UbiB family protein [Actinoplanes sp. NPDC051411]|uniref:ABC1 kinase family protein n=1 Tax=Actinoplanes sp. NPDC051411 TaxID=3155522 RepID=UPI003420228D
MALVNGLVAVLFWVVSVLVLAGLARRVLGVPVGWWRSVVFGLLLVAVSPSVLGFVGDRSGLLAGDRLVGDSAAAVLLVVLTIAWIFTLGLAALVVLEAILPTGTVPGLVTLVRNWRGQRRRTRRYTVIVGIAVRHGLGRFLRPGRQPADPGLGRTAVALRRALEDGGVAFVKLGQTLSTRRDLLPPALVGELSKLQSQAEPAPWAQIEKAIADGLGRPVGEVFASIEPVPLAAASVGQVHSARLLDGTDVVVKVQRPAARRQIAADLDIIVRLGSRLDRTTGWGRSLGVHRLAEGFAASLREELDYTVELENTQAVAAGLRPSDRIVVPRTFPELSSPTVLVMSRLPSAPGGFTGLAAEDRRRLAADLLGSVLHQIVVTGVFHADLHPGNVLIGPDGTVGLLDFGSVGRLDRTARSALGLLLYAIERDDPIAAASSLVELLGRPDELDQRALERDVGELMVRYRAGAAGAAGVFTALFRLVVLHRFAVPAQVAAAFRAMGSLEGTLTLLSPGFDMLAAAQEAGGDLMRDAFEPAAVRQTLEGQLASLLPILQRLPQRLNKIVEDAEQGRFTVQVRALADRRDRQFITGLAQQLMLTILAAAATLGAILLLTSTAGPRLTPTLPLYAFLGYVLLFVAFVLGLRVLVRVFFRGTRD